jgi:radical SAM protein with 4Fe4S-binding SPASM domain
MKLAFGRKKSYSHMFHHLFYYISHIKYYSFLNSFILFKGIPLKELIILKYPTMLPDAIKPPILTIDLTDACDLQCKYCNNPIIPQPRTFMKDDVVSRILKQIEDTHINRIRIGGGEPTLHPDFGYILKEISHRTKFVSIITNAQWSSQGLADELLRSKADLIEISVDAGGQKIYEKSRIGASYDKLLKNIAYLRNTRDQLKSKTIIKFRLMVRPSTLHLEKKETLFLLQYCDCLLPQLVTQHPDREIIEDVFPNKLRLNSICTLPFKDMQVLPDGNVPLCSAFSYSLVKDKQTFIGNICNDTILDLWNHDLMRELRQAQRKNRGSSLSQCRNCPF